MIGWLDPGGKSVFPDNRVRIWRWFVLSGMGRNLSEIFKEITEIQPAPGLQARIFQAVAMEKDRAAERKLWVSRLGLGLSSAVFLASVSVFGKAILQSEFWSIVSLVFSDLLVVARNWQDFSYSLLETFPTVGATAVLVPVMMLLFSFSVYLEAGRKHKYI